jgi:hypothetical protein
MEKSPGTPEGSGDLKSRQMKAPQGLRVIRTHRDDRQAIGRALRNEASDRGVKSRAESPSAPLIGLREKHSLKRSIIEAPNFSLAITYLIPCASRRNRESILWLMVFPQRVAFSLGAKTRCRSQGSRSGVCRIAQLIGRPRASL